ncbi:helix-turn-helix domain-containing protein [Devosia sp.]|uniref:AraC family transcriptional regulator n=1 Tax=Devosia sp. TaxID=1871048 RepID=UPI003BAB95B6
MLSDLIAHGHQMQALTPARGPVDFHVMATGAGFERRANEVYSWEGLKRGDAPFVVIQHTIAGRGELDFDGTRHALLPGSTMVLSFPHAHRYWLERAQSWEYFWIGANGREALRLARAIIDLKGPVITPAPSAVDRMAAACLKLIAHPDPLSGETSVQVYAALMALHDGLFGAAAPVGPVLAPQLARTLSFVDAHLGEPLGIDRLARVAGLSRAHFVRRFSEEVGQSPSDYVFTQRMARATRLLVATDQPVTTIAEATGFAGGNYFAKAFRRAHGQSPSEYRDRGGR